MTLSPAFKTQLSPLLSFIRESWPRCVVRDQNGSGFAGIDLPYPYTPPSIPGEGHFSFFFYWDTYFTNLGLLADGYSEQAKNNILNICWLIRKYGFMPNHVGLENRSQPPLLALMVDAYLNVTGDTSLLSEGVEALQIEHHFWNTHRKAVKGLNRYGFQETPTGLVAFYDQVADRIGLPSDAIPSDKALLGGHLMAEAESGWDFTTRFEGRCADFVPVDLNVFLYLQEVLLARFLQRLGETSSDRWINQANQRKTSILEILWCEESGSFRDYDFIHDRHSAVDAASGFMPLFAGIAPPEMAARQRCVLPLLRGQHGVACTTPTNHTPGCQWAFPNVWPPVVYFTARALEQVGHSAEASRLAETFLNTQVRLFMETGLLWEKYDARTGAISASEYQAAPMLGWTAGTIKALYAHFFQGPEASVPATC